MIKPTQQNVHCSTEVVSVLNTVFQPFNADGKNNRKNSVDRKRLFKSKRKADVANFPRRYREMGW